MDGERDQRIPAIGGDSIWARVPNLLDEVRQRWRRGDSAISIANKLGAGLTPNMIIGRMARERITRDQWATTAAPLADDPGLPASLRGARSASKQSPSAANEQASGDCFAPLAMTPPVKIESPPIAIAPSVKVAPAPKPPGPKRGSVNTNFIFRAKARPEPTAPIEPLPRAVREAFMVDAPPPGRGRDRGGRAPSLPLAVRAAGRRDRVLRRRSARRRALLRPACAARVRRPARRGGVELSHGA